MYLLSRKTTGYRKRKQGLPCEDAVLSRDFGDFCVLACADGHGDERCRYAARGAELAVRTAASLFRRERDAADTLQDFGKHLNDSRERLVQDFVSAWTSAVLDDYFVNVPEDTAFREQYQELARYARRIYEVRDGGMPVREFRALAEYRHRSEEAIYRITLLYGTTMNAAVVSARFVFAFGIGDGDVLAVNGKRVEWLLPPYSRFAESPASLCGAFGSMQESFSAVYLPVTRGNKLSDSRFLPEFVMIATDGLRNAFLSDEEFAEKLLAIAEAWKRNEGRRFVSAARAWLEERSEFGVTQDDISFAFCTKYTVSRKGRKA